ncbi:hypothetical protein KAS41_02195 [Candidatus Parcubacteria bacterium]|nr:hypothetical protein [Candidatus Parcubacteria bacterium]
MIKNFLSVEGFYLYLAVLTSIVSAFFILFFWIYSNYKKSKKKEKLTKKEYDKLFRIALKAHKKRKERYGNFKQEVKIAEKKLEGL